MATSAYIFIPSEFQLLIRIHYEKNTKNNIDDNSFGDIIVILH